MQTILKLITYQKFKCGNISKINGKCQNKKELDVFQATFPQLYICGGCNNFVCIKCINKFGNKCVLCSNENIIDYCDICFFDICYNMCENCGKVLHICNRNCRKYTSFWQGGSIKGFACDDCIKLY